MLLHIKKNRLGSWTNWICLLLASVLFYSCKKDEEKKPNEVRLEVFGPSPVLRGGELRFIGQNMDKITAVVLSDGQEITDIAIANSEEIRVKIPQDAVPGLLTLKYANGEIKTKTPLTFSEPIVIEKLSPLKVIAGDVLVIEGDYLNLIKQVIFTHDVVVEEDDFISHTREKMEVAVPNAAQTGKISLSNGEEIPLIVYSDEELEVTQPELTSIAPNPIKQGQELTIKGKYFQLVEAILFAGDVSVTEFAVNDANTEIKVTVPATAQEGTVKLITFSGVEIESQELEMVAPSIQALTPNPVKNGSSLKVSGADLDLVTSALYAGDVEGTIVAKSASSLTITVPASAKEGDLVLATASGKEVSAAYTLVRPLVTSTSSPIIGGQALTLNGTNLDLVTKVAFEHYAENVEITAKTATAIHIIVPNTVLGNAKILFTCGNEDVVHATTVSVTPTSLAYVSNMPAEANQNATVTLNGGNFDKVTAVTLGGIAVDWAHSGTSTMFVVVPGNAAPGNQNLVLMTTEGSTAYTLKVIGTGPIYTPIWTGSVDMGGWANFVQLPGNLFNDVVVGDLIEVTVDPASVQNDSQGSLKDGASWAEIADGTEYFDISGNFSLQVTEDVLTKLKANGLIIGGQHYLATKVSVVQ